MFACLRVHLVPTESSKNQSFLELEIFTVVSRHVSAENQTQVLWKSSQYSVTAEPSLQPLAIFL